MPRRRLRLAELDGRRRRLPVRRAPGSGLLLGLAALEEEADGHEDDDESNHCKDDGPRDARLALLARVAAALLAAAAGVLVGRRFDSGVFIASMASGRPPLREARPRRRDKLTSLICGTQVVEGMEVVKEIEGVPTDGRDKPIDAVRVETITIEE